jgi:hypothetical protein
MLDDDVGSLMLLHLLLRGWLVILHLLLVRDNCLLLLNGLRGLGGPHRGLNALGETLRGDQVGTLSEELRTTRALPAALLEPAGVGPGVDLRRVLPTLALRVVTFPIITPASRRTVRLHVLSLRIGFRKMVIPYERVVLFTG